MIGFYYGTLIPGIDAQEGVYFIKNDKQYSIYIKRENENAEKYGDTNDITSANLDALWAQIGETFVAKTFTVAGLSLENPISVKEMQDALKLQALAYKSEATGTLTDYVKEVKGFDYTPTGTVEVILGYGQTATVISKGNYTPKGTISGSTIAQGNISLSKNNNGFEVSGTVSTPNITVIPNTATIKQITGVGTLPSYVPAEYTAPSLESSSNTFAKEGVTAYMDGTVLNIAPAATASAISTVSFNKGNYIAATFNPGTLPTIDDKLSVVTDIASATASQPKFTGDKISATFTGVASDINATFAGTQEEIQVSGTYNQATVEDLEFKGNVHSFKPELITENKTISVS